ncbi:MAG: LemA family protein, partial [Acidiferrobacteraceae bacterium]|nr:LemA family protein [Acidiferrobacteraceae bacterium]
MELGPGNIILMVVILAVTWLAWIYNRFIRRKNEVREAWSGIDVQLKRRHNLIPNLIETVKGYAG